MDWLTEFKNKFGHYPELRDIKANKFHGSVEINFCAGVPMNYNYKMHRRAEKDIVYTDPRKGTTTVHKDQP